MRFVKGAAAFAVGAALATSLAFAAAPTDAIKARGEVMKGFGDNMKIIGDGLKSDKPDAAAIANAFHAIAAKANMVGGMFPKGSGPESGMKTRAKAEIWTMPDDFKAAVDGFVSASAQVAKVSATSSIDDLKAAQKTLGGGCGGCHMKFRAPEEKKAG
ncbi:MAG: c-type cytochrome [Candidatus Binataceae bacterium]